MPTASQLIKGSRRGRVPKKRNALNAHPQLSGIVLLTKVMEPKKPNSAKRKVARVRLSNGREVTAHIPAEGHNIQEHSNVLVRGGRVKDLPGVKYKIVRGAGDLTAPSSINGGEGTTTRTNGRSKVGQKLY